MSSSNREKLGHSSNKCRNCNFIFFSICFVMGGILTFVGQNIWMKARLNNQINLVKNSFNIFGSGNTEEAVAKYHSKDYVQYSDGNILNYNDLIAHVDHLKEVLESPVEISYDYVIGEGDKVCTVHRAKAVKKGGEKVEIKLIALHQIKDGKIILTDELTHVLKGSDEDKNMGSVH